MPTTHEFEPVLQVLTRCYRRPVMLAANRASLRNQTLLSWTQTLLVDDSGAGIGNSYARLAAAAGQLIGRYIWILDDDDVCCRPTLVAELAEIARMVRPDVVMVKMDHGPLGVLPAPKHWLNRPQRGQIGCSAFIVAREVWQRHAHAMTPGHYESDFDFIDAIWTGHPRPVVYWHDVIASRVQRISKGEPE